MDVKHIANSIKLDGRVEYQGKTAFFALKDHKENFKSSHPCSLNNPSKSELG